MKLQLSSLFLLAALTVNANVASVASVKTIPSISTPGVPVITSKKPATTSHTKTIPTSFPIPTATVTSTTKSISKDIYYIARIKNRGNVFTIEKTYVPENVTEIFGECEYNSVSEGKKEVGNDNIFDHSPEDIYCDNNNDCYSVYSHTYIQDNTEKACSLFVKYNTTVENKSFKTTTFCKPTTTVTTINNKYVDPNHPVEATITVCGDNVKAIPTVKPETILTTTTVPTIPDPTPITDTQIKPVTFWETLGTTAFYSFDIPVPELQDDIFGECSITGPSKNHESEVDDSEEKYANLYKKIDDVYCDDNDCYKGYSFNIINGFFIEKCSVFIKGGSKEDYPRYVTTRKFCKPVTYTSTYKYNNSLTTSLATSCGKPTTSTDKNAPEKTPAFDNIKTIPVIARDIKRNTLTLEDIPVPKTVSVNDVLAECEYTNAPHKHYVYPEENIYSKKPMLYCEDDECYKKYNYKLNGDYTDMNCSVFIKDETPEEYSGYQSTAFCRPIEPSVSTIEKNSSTFYSTIYGCTYKEAKKAIPSFSTTSTKSIPEIVTTSSTKNIPVNTTASKTVPTKTIPTSTSSTKTIPTSTTSTKTIPTSTTSSKTIPTSTTSSKTIPTSTTTTKTIPNGCNPITITVTEKETVTEKKIITITVTNKAEPTSQHEERCANKWAQCGGIDYHGPTCCQSGSTCQVLNKYYSQCV